jgi:hypothetical protein
MPYQECLKSAKPFPRFAIGMNPVIACLGAPEENDPNITFNTDKGLIEHHPVYWKILQTSL